MIKKASLSSLVEMAETLSAEDPGSACAYMAVQVSPGRVPAFYRSSPLGFVQSKGFDPDGIRHFVSLGHLNNCLSASADSLDLLVDSSGMVCIESVDGPYRNFMHVHTVREASSGAKYHSIGNPAAERLDPSALSGISVALPKELSMAQQPSLFDGRLCIGTRGGLVRYRVPSLSGVGLNPCRSFLRFACGGKADSLTISGNGYWICQKGGMVSCISSHRFQDSMRQAFESPGTLLATVDAFRLVEAMGSALKICGRNSSPDKTGKMYLGQDGVTCRDTFGNEAAFSLGPQPPWARFGIMGYAAELAVFFLRQAQDKDATIESAEPAMAGLPPARRISRGPFEVDFRILP